MKTFRQICILILGLGALFGFLGCEALNQDKPGNILAGRWQILDRAGLNEPHSFFWFTMDFVEFKANGTLLGLMVWPPDSGETVRLNKTAGYRILEDGRIEIIGRCRYEDPCSAVFEMAFGNGTLRLSNESAFMELRRSGPEATDDIPTVPGPQPTPKK